MYMKKLKEIKKIYLKSFCLVVSLVLATSIVNYTNKIIDNFGFESLGKALALLIIILIFTIVVAVLIMSNRNIDIKL